MKAAAAARRALSARLSAVAELVPPGARVADIGSDHALLPAWLVSTGKSPFAVAGEVRDGPLRQSMARIEADGLADVVAVRKGDGLAVIAPGEVDCVVIAGMGGALIASILDAGEAAGKLRGVRTLVLQPNVGEDLVRRWLLEHGWHLASERIVEEDGRWYEMLEARRLKDADRLNAALYDPSFLGLEHPPERLRALLLRMGPWLLRQPDERFFGKWRSELDKMETIRRQIERSDSPEAARKLRELGEEIALIGEVMACLQAGIS
ncbi:MAG: SAM-dependent methyltransferase [Thermobacillus sp. ZCTH02-B1]|uniref:tRNA (adenine(22)-N(1))-methyltransferase n=1 Tax=Thermobacillus sp. ZCTH02-B1 TaxID=1858795 RepID=UPI000B553C60|nr:class I SAM-dependent methyltransferase [Thermobacillus sp. ZCTH02-B1]OUM95960.1 MAG: SAM-dependent methyltransferase [Thermobacillus sp. ZCTH02-B1]